MPSQEFTARVEQERQRIIAVKDKLINVPTSLIEGGNQSANRRLSDLNDYASPVFKSYIALAETMTAAPDVPALTLAYVSTHAAQRLDDILSRLLAYAANENPDQNTRDVVRNFVLENLQPALYAVDVARASLDAASIDTITPAFQRIRSLGEQADQSLLGARAAEAAASKALADAEKNAVLKGITENVEAFEQAAGNHRISAMRWAVATGVTAATLIACALGGMMRTTSPPDPKASWLEATNLYFFGERVFLASVLSFVMVTCVRNFRAARHNQVLNDHRARSLKTFERLRAGATDDRMKDAILLQAAEAIFSMQVSGFVDGDVGVTHAHELLKILKPRGEG
jgi:hypothetical protein